MGQIQKDRRESCFGLFTSSCTDQKIQILSEGATEITAQATKYAEEKNMVYCEANIHDISGIETVIRSLIIELYTGPGPATLKQLKAAQ